MSADLSIVYTFWEKLVDVYTLYTGYIEVWLFYGYTANLTIFGVKFQWCLALGVGQRSTKNVW